MNQPDRMQALRSCRNALRRISEYVLEASLDERMLDLGERKEFLSEAEHAELVALLAFTEKRTLEKLEAEVALKRLESVYPELVNAS